MVGDIFRILNAPLWWEKKMKRLRNVVENYVAEDVVFTWSYKKCESLKFEHFLPKGCHCEHFSCSCNGREALLTMMGNDLRAFPNMRISHDFSAGDGGRLITQHEMSGTHLGPWCDDQEKCPPTGNWVGGFNVATVFSFEDNKIKQIEDTADFSGLVWRMVPLKRSQRVLGKAVNRFNKLINQKDNSVFDREYAEKVWVSCPFTKQVSIETRAELKRMHKAFLTAFPDVQCRIYSAFSDGLSAMTHSVCSATNTGPLWDGTKATGKKVLFELLVVTTLDKEDRVVKREAMLDSEDLKRQLGLKDIGPH
jgi:predicted ester cyclase